MAGSTWRVGGYLFAFVAFLVQGSLVWADAGDAHPDVILDAEAQAGLAVWRANACQTCHAVHGFGGFLGPDLTNAASRVPASRVDQLLQLGVGRMPAFHLSEVDRHAVVAYLRALDDTGQGTVRRGRTWPTPDDASLPTSIARGATLFGQRGCIGCHVLGAAPDLSAVRTRLDDATIDQILDQGGARMPALHLPPDERAALIGFLAWRAEGAPALDDALSDVPWFEFEP